MSNKIMRSRGEPVKPTSGPQILLVDDSDAARLCTRTILEALDAPVTEAASGQHALALLAARDFDLIVTDLEMAPVDGFALIANIQRLPPARRPKIIVCSSLVGQRWLRGRGELRAAAALVAKPVCPAALLEAVHDALTRGDAP